MTFFNVRRLLVLLQHWGSAMGHIFHHLVSCSAVAFTTLAEAIKAPSFEPDMSRLHAQLLILQLYESSSFAFGLGGVCRLGHPYFTTSCFFLANVLLL